MNGPNPALRVDGLTVRYGTKVALDQVSLSVARGSVYALLGRNGSGKSSLVRVLLGQQAPQDGRAEVLGEPSWTSRTRLMARVGVVPEEPDAPPMMTVRDLESFCRPLYPSWNGADFAARLDRFGIPADLPFGGLSKGQKGLSLLALALAPSPELLVLDDPTLGLDPVARKAFYEEVIGELADRGTTVFLTTHDLAGIEPIADRVGILKQGHLLLDEPIESLKARFRRIRYANEVTEERTELGNELDAFEAVQVKVRGWGNEAIVSNYDDAKFEAFRSTDGVVDAEATSMLLEEIFLAVAGEADTKNGGRAR
jgi:ABC-2 type transport system ATP-binding protein